MLRSIWIGTLALALASLSGCGGGGGSAPDTGVPAATLDTEGPALGKNQTITVRFTESMAVDSIRVAGSIGVLAHVLWKSEAHPNDLLLLTPPAAGWPAGSASLTLDARDLTGNPMETLVSTFVVPLSFSEFQAADLVLGQPDFTNGGSSPTSSQSLSYPTDATFSPSGGMFVVDSGSNRLAAYGSSPSENNAAHAFVVGQRDSSSNGDGLTRDQMSNPTSVSVAGSRMLIVDYGNFRALIYNSVPTQAGALPDIVLGAPDFESQNGGVCAPGAFNYPNSGAITDDGKVLIADTDNHRVLIWNRIPTRNGQAPDVVLGQPDGDHCAQNAGSVTAAATLRAPTSVWSDGKQVFVADTGNNRVLIWHSFPTSNMQPADTVLGQKTFALGQRNDDDGDGMEDATPTARTLVSPSDIAFNGLQLAVSDTGNHRVLIWNSLPMRNFEPASMVLGHRLFTSASRNDTDEDGMTDSPAANVLSHPSGVAFFGTQLFVADSENNRVLRFHSR